MIKFNSILFIIFLFLCPPMTILYLLYYFSNVAKAVEIAKEYDCAVNKALLNNDTEALKNNIISLYNSEGVEFLIELIEEEDCPLMFKKCVKAVLKEHGEDYYIEDEAEDDDTERYNIKVLPNGHLYLKNLDTEINLDKDIDELKAVLTFANYLSTNKEIDELYKKLARTNSTKEYEEVLKQITELESKYAIPIKCNIKIKDRDGLYVS